MTRCSVDDSTVAHRPRFLTSPSKTPLLSLPFSPSQCTDDQFNRILDLIRQDQYQHNNPRRTVTNMPTMQAVILPTTYSDPAGYQLSSVPRPQVTDPSDVVVRVHASSINPIDVKKASGLMKLVAEDSCVSRACLTFYLQPPRCSSYWD